MILQKTEPKDCKVGTEYLYRAYGTWEIGYCDEYTYSPSGNKRKVLPIGAVVCECTSENITDIHELPKKPKPLTREQELQRIKANRQYETQCEFAHAARIAGFTDEEINEAIIPTKKRK
jgi:hypothetical protein